ncbi:MAG: hypothetical protein LW817_00230 [Candidatus Caenarcaniphilales bacterium]|jgi:hypothetical protein|nr:hypothetical protein [Candidatus Caenarcaniphilales bacterium]
MNSHNHSKDEFEKELEEFFKERAQFRAPSPADSSKNKSAKARCDEDASEKFTVPSEFGSGCCMTGCHNCPWGYAVPG